MQNSLPPHLLQQAMMQQQGMPPQFAGQQNMPLPPNARFPGQQPLPARPNQFPAPPEQLVDGLSDEDLLLLQTALIEEYREKHPDLSEFELYIAAEVNGLLEEAKANGIFIPPKDAIEFGITQFRKKLNKAIQQERKKVANNEIPMPIPLPQNQMPQQFPPPQPQAREVNRLALNMDLNPSPSASVAKLSPEDIWNMPREQFLALDRKIRQQHYK